MIMLPNMVPDTPEPNPIHESLLNIGTRTHARTEHTQLWYYTAGCNYIRRHTDHNRYGQHHVMGAIKWQQFVNMNINPDQHSHSRGDRG